MRIIAGDYKGRRLETPKDNNIRPTTDKVKEAIFNTIMPYIVDSVCVDLFTGTGNLGLEALSRGAARCYFSDNSRNSMDITHNNINTCNATDYAVELLGDYKRNLSRVTEKVDIFFLDPPYGEGLYEDCFKTISKLKLLSDDGIIIAEHNKELKLPEEWYGYGKIKEKKYGTIVISIYG